jgi:hypothetical protein
MESFTQNIDLAGSVPDLRTVWLDGVRVTAKTDRSRLIEYVGTFANKLTELHILVDPDFSDPRVQQVLRAEATIRQGQLSVSSLRRLANGSIMRVLSGLDPAAPANEPRFMPPLAFGSGVDYREQLHDMELEEVGGVRGFRDNDPRSPTWAAVVQEGLDDGQPVRSLSIPTGAIVPELLHHKSEITAESGALAAVGFLRSYVEVQSVRLGYAYEQPPLRPLFDTTNGLVGGFFARHGNA